jgi:predicted amidohydrolase YtcJ
MKSFVDGSLGARSAALTAPYADGPGCGILVRERGSFLATIARAHAAGMQVAIHAIGDLAVDWALDGIEAAQIARPDLSLRHRVVHAQITRPDQLARFVRLGAVAEIQPKFVTTDKLWVESRVGAERASHSYCWKSMLEAGVPVAGGSDGPVEPLHPLLGIFAAVTRQGMDGKPVDGWLPSERLSVDQALRLFATGGAYAAGEESWRGSLAPGMAADFVVLNRSPYAVEPGALKDLVVEMTFIAGQQLYQRA